MNSFFKYGILFFFFFLIGIAVSAQKKDTIRKAIPVDSLLKKLPPPTAAERARADSIRKAFSPKKATFRSLVLPGWGQAYNKKYWKIPLVYGALGTATGIFFYNLKNYRQIRFAYSAKYNASLPTATAADTDKLKQIVSYLQQYPVNDLRTLRDEFRSNIDYSVLAFLLLWGFQVADATVDAHLKTFDVSPDLSFKLKLGPSLMAHTTGISLVLGIKQKPKFANKGW